MKTILFCRRSIVTLTGILCLTGLGVYQMVDVSYAISACVAAICAANSYEKVGKAKATKASVPYGQEG
jgi:hypothetical protein